MRRKLWHILFLGTLSLGVASCALVPDIIRPFEPKSATQTKKRQIMGTCYPVADKEIVYIVRKGDTLGEIAQCFNLHWHSIFKRNNLKNPNTINVGQKLIIPARSGKTAAKSSGTGNKGKSASRSARPPTRAKSGISWIWPAKGKVIRKFSPKASGKQGILIAGKMNQKVVSAATGKVVYSGEGLVGYGKLIIVQHKKDFLTAYAHNNRLLVKEGQSVKGGQTIAHMGKTAAKSPRLHFEVRYKGNPVDPLKYLP